MKIAIAMGTLAFVELLCIFGSAEIILEATHYGERWSGWIPAMIVTSALLSCGIIGLLGRWLFIRSELS